LNGFIHALIPSTCLLLVKIKITLTAADSRNSHPKIYSRLFLDLSVSKKTVIVI